MSTFRRGILTALMVTLGLFIGAMAALFTSGGQAFAATLDSVPTPVTTPTSTPNGTTTSSSTTDGHAGDGVVTVSVTVKGSGTATSSLTTKSDAPATAPATAPTQPDHAATAPSTSSSPTTANTTSATKGGSTAPATTSGDTASTKPAAPGGSAASSLTKAGDKGQGDTSGTSGTAGSGDTVSTSAGKPGEGAAGATTGKAGDQIGAAGGTPGTCAVTTETHDAKPTGPVVKPAVTDKRSVKAKAPCKPVDGVTSTGTTDHAGDSSGATASGGATDQPPNATTPDDAGATRLTTQVTLLPVVPALPAQPQQPRTPASHSVWQGGSSLVPTKAFTPASSSREAGSGAAPTKVHTTILPEQPFPSLPTDHPSESALGGYSVGASSSSGSGGSVDSGSSASAAILPSVEFPVSMWRVLYIQSFLMPSGITTSIQLPPW